MRSNNGDIELTGDSYSNENVVFCWFVCLRKRAVYSLDPTNVFMVRFVLSVEWDLKAWPSSYIAHRTRKTNWLNRPNDVETFCKTLYGIWAEAIGLSSRVSVVHTGDVCCAEPRLVRVCVLTGAWESQSRRYIHIYYGLAEYCMGINRMVRRGILVINLIGLSRMGEPVILTVCILKRRLI